VEGERREFLPPQAPGPEPELGPRPGPAWQPPAQASVHVPPAHVPGRIEPDNSPAVTGFVLSLVASGLLVISAGLSSLISIACAIFGIVYSRRGKLRVASGETTRNASLAQAGFVIGIVSLVLSVIATLLWILIAVLVAVDDGFRDDFQDELDDGQTVTAALRVAAAGGRALLR
jgi:hypothetical protein